MKHLTMVVAIGLWISMIAFTGCKSSETANSNKDPLKAGTENKHGAKLIIQYLAAKDETNIYQQDFTIKPQVMTDTVAASGSHSFDIHNMATFKGKVPVTAPNNASFTLTHSIASKNSWHFPPKLKTLVMVTDGEKTEIPIYSQKELDKDSPKDKEFYETLIMEMPYANYAKIAKAKDVEFQIGNGKFKLSGENILAFQDFTDYITPK